MFRGQLIIFLDYYYELYILSGRSLFVEYQFIKIKSGPNYGMHLFDLKNEARRPAIWPNKVENENKIKIVRNRASSLLYDK